MLATELFDSNIEKSEFAKLLETFTVVSKLEKKAVSNVACVTVVIGSNSSKLVLLVLIVLVLFFKYVQSWQTQKKKNK